jgi:hypothetical protein
VTPETLRVLLTADNSQLRKTFGESSAMAASFASNVGAISQKLGKLGGGGTGGFKSPETSKFISASAAITEYAGLMGNLEAHVYDLTNGAPSCCSRPPEPPAKTRRSRFSKRRTLRGPA